MIRIHYNGTVTIHRKDKEIKKGISLSTETIEGTPRSLESIDDVEGSNGFPLCVLSICYGVTDDLMSKALVESLRK